MKTNNKITDKWRECSVCWVYKPWSEFFRNVCNNQNRHSTRCKECYNKKIIEKIQENQIYNIEELNIIYYSDPVIINNIKILNWVEKNSIESKYYFFLNKWYEKKFLKLIFWNNEKYNTDYNL